MSTRRKIVIAGATVLLSTATAMANSATTSIEHCQPALQKDLYKYAYEAKLQEDYLRTIDSQTWQSMKRSGEFEGGFFDIISLGTSYDEFQSNVRKYFEQVHFTRDFATSTEIIRLVTAPRAYASYDKCLDSLSEERLSIVPQSEDLKHVVLKVRYEPPMNSNDTVTIRVRADGGEIQGKRVFKASSKNVWLVDVARTPGTSTTRIEVTASKYAEPQVWTSTRNDGWIQLQYRGTASAKVGEQDIYLQTYNNDNRKKGCKDVVAHTKADVCISGNVAYRTAPENHFFTNARDVECLGGGCGWTRERKAYIVDQDRTLRLYTENWGPSANIRAVADVNRRYGEGAVPCGDTSRIPVLYGQPIVIGGAAACRDIMTITYQSGDAGQNVSAFTASASPHATLLIVGPMMSTSAEVQRAFTLRDPTAKESPSLYSRTVDWVQNWWSN